MYLFSFRRKCFTEVDIRDVRDTYSAPVDISSQNYVSMRIPSRHKYVFYKRFGTNLKNIFFLGT